jgi:hypothetical protein
VTPQEWSRTLRRRWYILAAAALCSMVGVLGVHERAPGYEGCNSLALSGPPQAALGNEVYVDTNPAVAMVTQMVVLHMMSQPVHTQLVAQGVESNYQVTQTNSSGDPRFPQYTQPTLQICASSDQPAAVTNSVNVVTARFKDELRQMQAAQHVRSRSYITMRVLYPVAPIPGLGRPTQAYLGILLMGIIGGVAAVFWADPVTAAWRRLRARRDGSGRAPARLGRGPRISA